MEEVVIGRCAQWAHPLCWHMSAHLTATSHPPCACMHPLQLVQAIQKGAADGILEVVCLLLDIAEGLEYLHGKNILVGRGGRRGCARGPEGWWCGCLCAMSLLINMRSCSVLVHPAAWRPEASQCHAGESGDNLLISCADLI